MKWETIKNKAIAELTHRLNYPIDREIVAFIGTEALVRIQSGGQKMDSHIFLKNLKDEMIKTIENTDIRCYKDLMKLAPKAFPACAVKDNCVIELTDNGWEILPKLQAEY